MADGSDAPATDRGCSVLVSACLLGVACAHDGTANPAVAVQALRSRDGHRLIPVCPETVGGLPTPRPYAERSAVDGRVRSKAGDDPGDDAGVDVTDAYRRGAAHAVAVALASGARTAVLKARSPSCGCRQIYDGTFTRTRVDGEGVTAEALRQAGIEVVTEDEVANGWRP